MWDKRITMNRIAYALYICCMTSISNVEKAMLDGCSDTTVLLHVRGNSKHVLLAAALIALNNVIILHKV